MSPQSTGTTMTAHAPERARDLFALTTNGWTRNVEVMSKYVGAPAVFAGAITAVDQWANAMSWALKAQRQCVVSLASAAKVVSGLGLLERTVSAVTPSFAAVTERIAEPTPLAEIESALRVAIRQAEERRAAEVQAEQDALIAQAKAEQVERDGAVAVQDARRKSEQAPAAPEKAAHEGAERVKAELAEDVEKQAELAKATLEREALKAARAEAEAATERERLARNAARRDARKAARLEAERAEAAAKKAAQAARAAERAAVRRTARATYVGRLKADLVAELVGRGLPKTGNVPDLIGRLVDADLA